MTKWEYLVERLRTPDDETHLNERGSEGWELIDIRVTGQACVWLTFKRPLVEDKTENSLWRNCRSETMPDHVQNGSMIYLRRLATGEEFGPTVAEAVNWSFVHLYCQYRVVNG